MLLPCFPRAFPFSQINFVKLFCVISQYKLFITKQNKTYFVLFSLSLFGFTMALKCTYVSVAKQNFRGSVPPDPVGEVRNLGDGPETRMER